MSLWRWTNNDEGIAVKLWGKKDQEYDRLAAKFVAERNRVIALKSEATQNLAAWDDLMVAHEALKRELALVTMAEAYRTKERDILLAGGVIETQLGEIENPLGALLEQADRDVRTWRHRLDSAVQIQEDLRTRIQWAINQHHDITEAGRCKKCNVGHPCRTVRILTGTEELAL